MKDQRISPIDKLHLTFLSYFGTGYSPKAPGTVGSLATLPLIYLFSVLNLSFTQVLIFTIILFILACFSAHHIQEKFGVHDPGWIVIDEVVGMLVTWLFIFPEVSWRGLTLVFILFRIFDIIKIFPANWLDKNIKNGAGTIIDDVASALYAGFLLLLVKNFTGLI